MRHNKKFNHLGRQAGHRKAMLANMASSLILHKRIETTVAKAKAVKMYLEPLVTKSKSDTTHQRRTVFSYLKQKEAVTELFRTIAPKIGDRPGGYLRILRTGFRLGDAAEMCIIEFVDFNDAYTFGKVSSSAPAAASKTRRSRSKAAAKSVDSVEDATVVAEEGAEAPKKKAAAKKPAAAKTAKPAAPRATKASTSKAATAKTNVGRKM
ncbi:MAG: 50S ribosomal protein L17 [Rikenellaceae bacterium]